MRLNLSGDDWLESSAFVGAYKELLTNQLTLAHMNGFERGWLFGD